jgi:hypothetical protein
MGLEFLQSLIIDLFDVSVAEVGHHADDYINTSPAGTLTKAQGIRKCRP